ncbi:MAG: hypothetical protein WD554_04030 [Flavobacteriaceae bacterium]
MNFDKKRYKVYTWKNWMMLHWILNPGLAINELILGQRVPKVTLEDRTIDKPRIERTRVPCPHCETLNDGRTWSTENGTAFKNWFGLYCKNCGNIIPCLMNAFSFIILALTFPIWGWFKRSLKTKWLSKQPERYEHIDIEHIPHPFDEKSWVASGLNWGAFMFVLMSIVYPYFTGGEITLKTLVLGVVIWTIGGLGYGYTMKLYMNKKAKNKVGNNI